MHGKVSSKDTCLKFGKSLNPFKQNGSFHAFQVEKFISVLRAVKWYVPFYSKCIRTLCKQSMENLIRRKDMWHHVLFCAICLCPI